MNKVLIFDFDGTIAETSNIIFDVIQKFVPSFTRELYLEEMRKYFLEKSVKELLKASYLEVKLKLHAKKIRNEINSKILAAKVFPAMQETLHKLKSQGNKLIILSSNYEENIREFLIKNDLNIFDEIHGDGHILRKGIQLVEISSRFSSSDIFYIGDELRDIDAARAAKVNEIGVTWGLNTKADFEAFNTRKILERIEELLEI